MERELASSEGSGVVGVDADRPAPRTRSSWRPGFGAVLLLILAQLIFRLAAPDVEWANVVSIILQAAILGAALAAARIPRTPARLAWGLIAVVVALSLVALLDPATEVGTLLILTAGLVVLTPSIIVFGAIRSLRATGAITLDLMFGVLGIYLLLGHAFSLVFQAIGDLDSGEFFADGAAESTSNFLYFSFATMTTVGYGDLAAAEGIGRAFAVALALLGQIYLVTVVAVIVSGLGTRSAR